MVQLAASFSALARGVLFRIAGQHNDLLGQRNPLILRVDLGIRDFLIALMCPVLKAAMRPARFAPILKSRGQDCLVRKQP